MCSDSIQISFYNGLCECENGCQFYSDSYKVLHAQAFFTLDRWVFSQVIFQNSVIFFLQRGMHVYFEKPMKKQYFYWIERPLDRHLFNHPPNLDNDPSIVTNLIYKIINDIKRIAKSYGKPSI